MFGGIPIKPAEHLRGADKAIKQGGVIHVSPAMYDLIRNAGPDELRDLIGSIKVMNLDPKPPSLDHMLDTLQIMSHAAGMTDQAEALTTEKRSL